MLLDYYLFSLQSNPDKKYRANIFWVTIQFALINGENILENKGEYMYTIMMATYLYQRISTKTLNLKVLIYRLINK